MDKNFINYLNNNSSKVTFYEDLYSRGNIIEQCRMIKKIYEIIDVNYLIEKTNVSNNLLYILINDTSPRLLDKLNNNIYLQPYHIRNVTNMIQSVLKKYNLELEKRKQKLPELIPDDIKSEIMSYLF